MKIGVIGAIHEEIESLLQDLELTNTTLLAGRTYFEGKLYGIDAVLVFARWGKVASATTATTLINLFNIDQIIFTGVAGSAQSHVNIGDVIIASNCIQHDIDASPIFDKHEIPLLNIKAIKTTSELSQQTENAAKQFIDNISEIVGKQVLANFGIENPTVHTGTVATGDHFISSQKRIDEIRHDIPEVLCIDMESAVIAQVCYEHGMPFAIVRTISDKADDTAPTDFSRFTAAVVNHYSCAIVKNLLLALARPVPQS